MAKLYDSSLWQYSLSSLLTKYRLGEKLTGSLGDTVERFNLLKSPKGNDINKEAKTYKERAIKFAYNNMDLLQELDFASMALYANHDTAGTARLFSFLYTKVGDKLSHYYSNIQKICVDIRAKGIAVDMNAVNEASKILSPILLNLEQSLYKRFNKEINLRSTTQLPEQLLSMGYDCPKTDKGNPSINKEFLEENTKDSLLQDISKFRTIDILLNHFIIKTKDMQQYSCPDVISGSQIGRVFPEMNLLEARTGRFSSACPNIQNIPKRNKEYASLCRAIFIPSDKKNKWYSLDWSNQEGRLQLHYATLKNFNGAKKWLDKFVENPRLDVHSLVATMMGGVDRDIAKTIYLGKSFCMGRAKTAKRLGLPTAKLRTAHGIIDSSGPEATALIEKYERAFPYLTDLQKDCMNIIVNRGYITTISGRQCKRPPQIKGKNYDYKAISLLIQGSAADQMYAALTEAHNAGIDIKCIVHDEFNIEGSEADAKQMQKIMETCTPLKVPSIAEIKIGSNWGNLKDLKHECTE